VARRNNGDPVFATGCAQRYRVAKRARHLLGGCLYRRVRRRAKAGASRTTKGAAPMLMRFDPFRELDRLTEQLASTAARAPRAFPMDAYRRGDQFIVEFDLPGVEPGSIELTVEKNVLGVRAERRFEPREGDEVVVAERPHGTYTRQLFLGDTLDSENVQANYEHGVLTLTIPVAEAAKPRRVSVGAGQGAQTIEPPTPARRPSRPSSRSRRPKKRHQTATAELHLKLRLAGRPGRTARARTSPMPPRHPLSATPWKSRRE
jgi:HSP20 family protein